MNKGKRSLEVDLTSERGRELVSACIAAARAFLTNFPARGWLSYKSLAAARDDVIMVLLTGNRDGTSEVDYTVNPATGFPWATGPRNYGDPLNSVLPAWDITMGEMAAVGLLAAERHRIRTGEGQLVRVALSDVAFAVVGHLGRIAGATLGAHETPRDGNYLYGAFGHDFATSDGRRVMVVALTTRQWEALVEVTGLRTAVRAIEQAMGVDLQSVDERFRLRDLLAAVLRPWFETRTLEQVRAAFQPTGVSWGAYQTFHQLVHEDPRVTTANDMWELVEHPGVGTYRMPGTPLEFSKVQRLPVRRAPILGEHTEQVLSDLLGLTTSEIGALERDRIVRCSRG
jgi:2-methylfumaryl-CoA isomerase